MAYRLSDRSKAKLDGVHPDLVKVVKRAIEITKHDFLVLEGLRTMERQRWLKQMGRSKTLNSRHLTGHAVDLGAWDGVTNSVVWDWPAYFKIAEAMQAAAKEYEIDLTWGGAWRSILTSKTPEELVDAYVTSKRKQDRSAFLDGPHYELSRKSYPSVQDVSGREAADGVLLGEEQAEPEDDV